MKQIKAHIAVSLDGHTATLDKELDWLPREIKNIVGKQYLEADCLLMGAKPLIKNDFKKLISN